MEFRGKDARLDAVAPDPTERRPVTGSKRPADTPPFPSKVIEIKPENGLGDNIGKREQEQVHRQLSHRREAVRAHRAVGHFNGLPPDAASLAGNKVMNDTPTIKPPAADQRKPQTADKPHSGGRQASFNPLHPSSELPPEQLIRLLGLQEKKTRKKKSAAPAAKSRAPSFSSDRPAPDSTRAPATKARAQQPQTQAPTQTKARPQTQARPQTPPAPVRPMRAERPGSRSGKAASRRQHARPPARRKRGTGLRWAIGLAVLAGVGASVYRFWPNSSPAPDSRSTQAARQQAPVSHEGAPVQAAPDRPRPLPTAPSNDPRWRAAVAAREQELKAAAEKRLRARIEAQEQSAPKSDNSTAVGTRDTDQTQAVMPVTRPAVSGTPATDSAATEEPTALDPPAPQPVPEQTSPETVPEQTAPEAVPATDDSGDAISPAPVPSEETGNGTTSGQAADTVGDSSTGQAPQASAAEVQAGDSLQDEAPAADEKAVAAEPAQSEESLPAEGGSGTEASGP